jgi:hypothetical protein
MPTRFAIQFSSQRQEGKGVLADISYTGAQVEDAEVKPRVGAHAVLYLCLPDEPTPFELAGKVVHHTETGFTVEYEKPHPDVCRRLDDVAALIAAPGESPLGPTETESTEEESSVTQTRKPEMPPLSELLIERATAEIARRREEAKQRLDKEIAGLAERKGSALEDAVGGPIEDTPEDQET